METRMRVGQSRLMLIEPLTYMNLSGEAVAALVRMLKIDIKNIVAIVDEYNFPVGKVHLKRGGSDGGHNGISSLIDELGSADFYRLRCGIGRDFGPGGLVDYVLAPFDDTQTELRDQMIKHAVDAVKHLARIGAGRAMSDINSGTLWKPKEKNTGKPKSPPDNAANGSEPTA